MSLRRGPDWRAPPRRRVGTVRFLFLFGWVVSDRCTGFAPFTVGRVGGRASDAPSRIPRLLNKLTARHELADLQQSINIEAQIAMSCVHRCVTPGPNSLSHLLQVIGAPSCPRSIRGAPHVSLRSESSMGFVGLSWVMSHRRFLPVESRQFDLFCLSHMLPCCRRFPRRCGADLDTSRGRRACPSARVSGASKEWHSRDRPNPRSKGYGGAGAVPRRMAADVTALQDSQRGC